MAEDGNKSSSSGKAYYVTFPEYRAKFGGSRFSAPTGHAGVILQRPDGYTKYYEFGRYNPNGQGIVGTRVESSVGNYRNIPISNIYSSADLKKVAKQLAKEYDNGEVWITPFDNIDYDAAYDYIIDRINADAETKEDEYNYFLPLENCATFVEDVIEAGGQEVDAPLIYKSPRNYSRTIERKQRKPYIKFKKGGKYQWNSTNGWKQLG